MNPSLLPKTPDELIARLIENPIVVGISRYGSNAAFKGEVSGDIDLFVIVNERPDDVESLHFHVGERPVDLNVRTFDDLHRSPPMTPIDESIVDAEVLFDRTGAVATTLRQVKSETVPPLTDHDIGWNRFCHQHLIDKVKGRLTTQPILCALLLNTNIYWLIQTYFRVRLLPYRGEKVALAWLEEHEPELFAQIGTFYASVELAEKLSITEKITDWVLEPIGGRWKRGELITFGTREDASDLVAQGEAFFKRLMVTV